MSVPFIQPTKDGFRVCAEGARMLSNIKTKIAIVSVTGPYRTGKSFLLNRLIDRADGFQVGSTVNACTKGIWLWGKPIRHGDTTYLFMDTEGLGSTDQEVTFDTKIFSLSVLLSSLFVLNTQGTISENALEQLELVVECTKQIQLQDGGSSDMADLSEEFPSFLWVLRDFSLRLQDEDGDDITAGAYLEKSLRPLKQKGARAESKNRIRQAIKTVFPRRDCVTLVRPVVDEHQLQNLSGIPYKKLRREFREGMEALRSTVFHTARPKTVRGAAVTGPALVKLAEAYVDALNAGAVPTIYSAWESVIALQARDALDAAREAYNGKMKENFSANTSIVLEASALHSLHNAAEQDALRAIRAILINDDAQRQKMEADILRELRGLLGDFENTNLLRSRVLSQDVLEAVWSRHALDGKDFPSGEAVTKAYDRVLNDFLKQASGPAKEEVARVFLERKRSAVLQNVFDKASSLQRKCEKFEKEVEAVKQESQTTADRLSKEGRKTSEALTTARKDLEAAQKKLRKVEVDYNTVKQELADYKKASQSSKAENAQQVMALESEVKALKSSLKKARAGVTTAQETAEAELQKLKDELLAAKKDAKAARKEAEKEVQQLKDELQVAKKDAKSARKAAASAAETGATEGTKLAVQLAHLQEEYDTLNAEVEDVRTQSAELADEASASNERLSAVQAELDTAQEENAQLTKKWNKATASQEKAREALESAQQEIADLTAQLDELQSAPPVVKEEPKEESEETSDESEEEKPAPPKKSGRGKKRAHDTDDAADFERARKATVPELKRWLTSLDVELPPRSEKKAFYQDLLYKTLPHLKEGGAPPKKRARRK